MIVKTKKYQLDPKEFRRLGMRRIIRSQWWLPASIFAGIIVLNLLLNLIYPNVWIYFLAPLGVLLWWLFWYAQFTGIPYMEQNKPMFERLSYEITPQHILIKKNQKEGMMLKWDMIKGAEKLKDGYLLLMGKVQFLWFPFSVFQSEKDIKFMEVLLKRKGLLQEKGHPEAVSAK
ncbi:YcxB family protein [Thermonema rossianum]|uniref:YcxB family protein n=1 Tax=Thermonema rossianum TaxID=55505 RepID=UPI000570233E|nr:YcxB family protein [Thermonema rossianum]